MKETNTSIDDKSVGVFFMLKIKFTGGKHYENFIKKSVCNVKPPLNTICLFVDTFCGVVDIFGDGVLYGCISVCAWTSVS